MTYLPLDDDMHAIPALRLKATGGAHAITAAATSARNSTAFNADTRVVSVYATGNVYLRFGGASVTASASDHYFPTGVYYDFAIGGGGKVGQFSHIAVLRADSADCSVYISEKE
jgi:hypothetical protein